jgi:hypothetical protein
MYPWISLLFSVSSPSVPIIAIKKNLVSFFLLALLAQVWKKLADTTIAITASGVKVTLRERYSLYASEHLDTCSDPDHLQPLMRFECTTATLLLLSHPTKAPVLNTGQADTSTDKREACARLFQTLISNPEQVCHRAVTIEPYL